MVAPASPDPKVKPPTKLLTVPPPPPPPPAPPAPASAPPASPAGASQLSLNKSTGVAATSTLALPGAPPPPAPPAAPAPPAPPAEPTAPAPTKVPPYAELFGSQSYVKNAQDPKLQELGKAVVAKDTAFADTPAGKAIAEGKMGPTEVTALQEHLKSKGYDVGKTGADGKYGPNTHQGLSNYLEGKPPGPIEQPKPVDPHDHGPEEPETPTDGKGAKDYKDLKAFAESRGFYVTSTNGGAHNTGSAHYQGRAIDVRTRDKSSDQVNKFIAEARAAGFTVHDERSRPPGQRVWSGPHVHVEIKKG